MGAHPIAFEHLFRVGTAPLAALTIHTRWVTKSLNLLPHYHLLSASTPFIIPHSDQYGWLHCSVSQKTSWMASCWLFSRIACFLNCVQCEGQLYELIKACRAGRCFSVRHEAAGVIYERPHPCCSFHGYLSPPCGCSGYFIPSYKCTHCCYIRVPELNVNIQWWKRYLHPLKPWCINT